MFTLAFPKQVPIEIVYHICRQMDYKSLLNVLHTYNDDELSHKFILQEMAKKLDISSELVPDEYTANLIYRKMHSPSSVRDDDDIVPKIISLKGHALKNTIKACKFIILALDLQTVHHNPKKFLALLQEQYPKVIISAYEQVSIWDEMFDDFM